jgi:hypothetical protein
VTNVSLPEMVALFAYAGEGFSRSVEILDYGLAGALLAELALAQRLAIVDGKVVPTNASPTGEVLCDSALRRMERDPVKRAPRDWVLRLSKDARRDVLDRLVQKGLLRRQKGRLLGALPSRYTAVNGRASLLLTEALSRVRGAVTAGPGEAADPTTTLCGLIEALGWARLALPDLPPQVVDHRLAELRDSVWPAIAVKSLVDEGRAGAWGPTVGGIMKNLDDWPKKR